MTSSVSLPVSLSSTSSTPSSSAAINGISSHQASSASSSSSTTNPAASGAAPPTTAPTTTTSSTTAAAPPESHPDSDSEAETIVLLRSRGRSRGSRIPFDDSPDDARRSRKPNGDSRDSGDSKDARDSNSNSRPSVDDAYSSDLSSAPSSRAPSKRPLPTKDLPRKRTASPSRLTHSPPRRKIQKIHADDDAQKRRSLKRKARDDSLDRPAIDSSDDDADDRRRSPRGIRIKSSPPMSPPPLPSNGNSARSHSTRDSHTSTAQSSSSRSGHARKKSVPHSVASSSAGGKPALSNTSAATPSAGGLSAPKPIHKAKRSGGRPAPLHLTHDHSDADVKSTSSSRSNSPGLINNGNMRSSSNSRRRRPSFSGQASAASPARLIGPGHKMKRDKTGRNQLHKICSKGGLEEAKACFEAEPDLLNDADNAGYLPLHAAALAGHNDIVGWLIDEGALVDKPAEDLSTPLLDAVENMHVHVVNTLLEHGADPRHRNKAGQSSVDLASTIRQQSDDPEEEAKMGLIEDALRAALVKLRNKKRADEEARKMAATESSSSRAASVASPSHFSPPPQSNQISTSSSRRRTGRGEPTRNEFLWLDAGKGGQAKLKQASRDGDMEMAGKLLESGIVPDPESMMLAARGGHLDVLNLLVAFGGDCDPDPKDVVRQHTKDKSQFPLVAGEETPLLATIGRNNIEVLKLLLKSDTMKEPRRLDNRGRTYMEIARQRAGENWEEEVKMLQKVWDDAGPKSKKSSRERPDSSPVTTRKDRDKEKDRKSERREAKAAEEVKKPKRLRRRSASPAASSAVDDTAPSERERDLDLSPAIARSKLKDLDKQKRRDRAVESDYSAISDSNATVDSTKPTTTKKRRLVLGKDLAPKTTEKERPKDEKPQLSGLRKRSDDAEPAEQARRDKKEKKKPPPEDEDVDMADTPKIKKKVADPERNARRERSIDKRHREGSSSSARPTANDHTPDADMLTRRRKRLEDEAEVQNKSKSKDAETERPSKSKEERLAERESRRAEATKQKTRSEKSEKPEKPSSNDATKESEEAAAAALEQRKREKKKRREEALRESAAKEDSPVIKRAKDRDATASDLEKKPRPDKDRPTQSKDKEKEKDKDAMDIDTDPIPVKRKKHTGDADNTADDSSKLRKRKSNDDSPAPAEDKAGSRHSELANGRSNRGASSTRDDAKKVESNDDAMLTEERERELERERQRVEKEKEQREQERKEQERKKQEAKALEEKRREQERLEQQRREQERREQERLEQERLEKERLEKERLEKERLEKQRLEQQRLEQERLEQERLEQQRLERERLERERIEKEQKEAFLRAQELAEKREEERRRRLEVLRASERRLIGASLSLLDSTYHQSLALHTDNQARFDELRRIERLPHIYRLAAMADDKEAFAQTIWQNFCALMPLCIVEGSSNLVSNAQACVILGCPHDLDMQTFPNLEKRPATAAEKVSLKNNLHPVFASFGLPRPLEFDAMTEWERQEVEREKFLALDNIFLFKVSELYKILHSDERYRFIVDKHLHRGALPTVPLCVAD
ncbi:Set3 complex subunit [Orbilia brochopaga]|uniref:Set3 complex subunit n=1 Tax=Orbilia brochopaga TaxID=3140254 RepID=A0AAV9U0A3_9PEZI